MLKMKVNLAVTCLFVFLFVSGGVAAQGNDILEITYDQVNQAGKRLDFTVKIKNISQETLYRVSLVSDQIEGDNFNFREIAPMQVVSDQAYMWRQENKEPDPIVWKVKYMNDQGRRKRLIVD